ncbi:YadA-like family protein [Veillonella intestinalis]|uniref:YadA-like family protein n=1 Tax=Veillonella intestinalis TaxID=2941341 RepID=UPI00203CB0EF|nr:YadA-like family protein [Veillonella intestinalis]
MKSSKDKHILSKLIAATLMGTVGLSMYTVDAVDTLQYVSINSTKEANKDNSQAGVEGQGRDVVIIGPNTIGNNNLNYNAVIVGSNNTAKNLNYKKETNEVTETFVNGLAIVGNNNYVKDAALLGDKNIVTGTNAVVVGDFNKNYGEHAVNIGYMTTTNGVDSIAIGRFAKGPTTSAIAVGAYSETQQVGSVALGNGAIAKSNGVAIGYKSIADRTGGEVGYFSTYDTTDRAALAEKIGKKADYDRIVATIQKHADLAQKEKEYNNYISERQKNQDLLNSEMQNLYKYDKDKDKYQASLEKIKEYGRLVNEQSEGEISLRQIISKTNNPDYKELDDARNEYYNLFAPYASIMGAVSVGNREEGIYRQITGVAAGSEDTDAVNVAQLKAARVEIIAGENISSVESDISKGYTEYKVNAVDTKITNVAFDKDTNTLSITTNNDEQPFAVTDIASKDDVTTAVGNSSWTLGVAKVTSITTVGDGEATAVGTPTEIKNGNTVTLRAERGIKLNQDGTNIDIGLKYIDVDPAVDAQPLAISDAKASGGGTLAVGQNSIADGHQGTAVGLTSHAGEYSLAVGAHADASAFRSIALGYNTQAGQYGVATGSHAKAVGNQSVAIGTFTVTNGTNSIGIGLSTKKDGATSDAPDQYLPKTNSEKAIAIGAGSYVGEKATNSTVIGVGNKIMGGTTNTSNNAVLLGTLSSITEGRFSLLLGNMASINKSQNAVGVGSQSNVGNSLAGTAVGYLATVTNAAQGTAVGGGSKVTAAQATALGGSSEVSTVQGVAVGYSSYTTGAQGVSIGSETNTTASRGVALGYMSNANTEKGIVGYNPLTNTVFEGDTDAALAGTLGKAEEYNAKSKVYNEKLQVYLEKNAAYEKSKTAANREAREAAAIEFNAADADLKSLISTYKSGYGAVSVGKEGYTRQITNVAAGTADSDAVNVMQLKQLRATGINYSGDDTTVIHRDLGDELTIAGGADVSTAEAKAKLTTGNIGVVANDTTDGLELKLAKDINLTADGSVAFGTAATAPKVDVSGLTISDQLKFTNAGILAGNQIVDNMKSAISDKAGDTFSDKLDAALATNANSAVNVGDLNSVTDELADKIGDANTAAESKLGKFTVGTDAAAQEKGIAVDKDNTRFDILGANENITTAIEERQVKIGLANTLNLTDAGSISFGNGANAPKVDATGLTISDKLKFTTAGISAGDQTIDNVKSAIAGKDGAKFTDKLNAANESNPNSAVNVSDLKQTAEVLAGQIGDINTAANSKLESFVVGADKNATAAGITVDKGTEGKTNRFDIVGANENITTKVNDNTIEVGLAKDLTLTDGSITTTTKDGITTKVDGTGVTITPSNGDATKTVSLTNEGLNNGGNKITNVADGDVSANSKDAVNGSQLHAVKEELKGDINKLESKLGAAGDLTKVDQNGNPIDDSKLVTGNDGKNYNPSDVDENGNPKDGAKPVESTLGSGAGTSGLGLDNKDNSKPITEQEAKDIVGGTPGADGQPGKDGLLDKIGPSLSNLATIKDLQAVAQAGLDFGGDTGDTAHRALSQKLTVNGGISNEEQLTDNNIGVVSNGKDTLTVKLAKDINLGKDGSVTTGNTSINNDGLTVKGEDGNPGTTVGSDGMVVNGDDGKPATIVGKDGISTNGKDGISVNGEDGSSTTIKPDGVTSKDPNGNSTVLGPNGVEVKDKDGNTVVTINDKGISNNNGGPTNLNDGLSVPGGLVVLPGEQVNGQYVPGTGTISAEGNRIQNVAHGIEPNDAVNVGQLSGVKRDLNNRMNTIGAHAAAMAALHPMEYLEEEKLSIAAGVGTFQSKQAVAVGAFYRPNDDTMFSVGGSFGGNENMFNVGVSLRVGQDSDYAKGAQNYKQAPLSTLTVLDDKVNTLEKENAALKDQLEEQREQIKLLMERLGM